MIILTDPLMYFGARSKRKKPRRAVKSVLPLPPSVPHKRGPGNSFAHTRTLIAEDIGFLTRSGWERNVIRILRSYDIPFEYEPHTFKYPIKSGSAKGYTPDLKIILPDGNYEWIELKGYFDKTSALKIKRFRIYHPEEFAKLTMIIGREKKSIELCERLKIPQILIYHDLSKLYKSNISNWEGV